METETMAWPAPGNLRVSSRRTEWLAELGPMVRLAVPVVLAELGWMAMGVVDTICVGRLSPEAIGAVGIGHVMFFSFAIIGVGLLLGLDTLVAQAIGANRHAEARSAFVQGIYLALGVSLPLMGLVELAASQAHRLNLDPQVGPLAISYVRVVNLSLSPLLLYVAFRRYLQASGGVGSIVFALVSANLLNLAANWILIFGKFGAPAMGVVGSAWATMLSRTWMFLVLVVAVWWQARGAGLRFRDFGWRFDRRLFRGLMALGLPASMQLLLEIAIFSLATLMAGWFDAVSLASHQIALNVASLTYMVPLGISAAAAVRVGQAIGRGDRLSASRSGWTALAIGCGFMTLTSAMLILVPRSIVSIFTDQADVIRVGGALLGLAAIFQLSDAIQVISTGSLRGGGDTRTPMLASFGAHWGVGLPLAWLLAFPAGYGVWGIWLGLSIGLIVVGTVLVFAWARFGRRQRAACARADRPSEVD